MLHFFWVQIICLDKNVILFLKNKYNFIWKLLITYDPIIYKMDHLTFIVSNQKEEPIDAFSVKISHRFRFR